MLNFTLTFLHFLGIYLNSKIPNDKNQLWYFVKVLGNFVLWYFFIHYGNLQLIHLSELRMPRYFIFRFSWTWSLKSGNCLVRLIWKYHFYIHVKLHLIICQIKVKEKSFGSIIVNSSLRDQNPRYRTYI